MAGDVVGEVRVKVRPDATGFRRETDKDVDNALRGVRAEVPIDGKLRVDRNQVQRQIDAARQKLRGGDVKIIAKLETQIDDKYQEWLKATQEVKRTQKQLAVLDSKYRGRNREKTDFVREMLERQKRDAEALRTVYEELNSSADILQARDNKRIHDLDDRRDAALAAEKARLRELNAAQLFAERDKQRILGKSALAEEELERRRTQNRLKASFDYQRKQKQDNADIELENRRHLLAMMDHRSSMSQAAQSGNLQDYLMSSPTDKFLQMNAKAVNDSFKRIRDEADRTSDHIDKLDPQLKVEPVGLLAMAAQMKWASRPRTVPFYVTIDAKSYAIAAGMLKSLSGLGVLNKLGNWAEDILVNFDKFAIKSGTVAVAIGGLVSSFGWLGTAAVGVADDLLNLSAGLLFLPATIASVAANVAIHAAAFKDFGAAVDGDNEALAKLPKNAQEAAKSLRGLWDEMSKPIQEKFWEGMGDSFTKTVEQLAPKFTEGLADSALHIGAAWAEVGRAMRELDDRGDLQKMLADMTLGFENAVGAAHPLAEAINIIGLRGSEQLPRFGGWVRDIGIGFRDWIKVSDDSGKLTEWLLGAEESLGHIGSITKSTVRQFMALADVSKEAGAEGLAGMADSMDRIADTMGSEPWQSDMVVVLRGARRGASELNDGFLDLSRSVGDASVHFGRMLDLLGQLGGEALTSVSIVVDNKGFQAGTTRAVEGMLKMVRDLAPAFDDAATVGGIFGTLAGEVFGNVGGLIGDVVGLVKDLALELEDNLVGLVPILGDNLRLLVEILSGPIEAVFGVLNNILGVFNDMPGPIQTAVLALAGLLAMRGSLGSLIGMVGNKGTAAFASLTNEVKKQPGMLDPLRLAWREQLRMVDKLNPATMKYATSVKLVGEGRAVLGHVATAYEHINQAAKNYEKTSLPLADSARKIGTSFTAAGRGLYESAGGLREFGRAFAGGFMSSTVGELDTVRRGLGDLQGRFRDFSREVGQDMRDLPGHARGGMMMTSDLVRQHMGDVVTNTRMGVRLTAESLGQITPDPVKRAFSAMSESASAAGTRMVDSMRAAGGRIVTAVEPIRSAGGTIVAGFRDASGQMAGPIAAMRTQLGSLATSAGKAAGAVGGAAATSLKMGVSGLVGALGGGWGVAIMGAIALVGAFASKNSEAKQKVDSLTAALDEQTGKLNEGGIKQIAESWTDLDEAGDWWANTTRGAKAANETMDALGISLGNVTGLIVQGGGDFDTFVGHLENIAAFKATEAFGFDHAAVDIVSMKNAAEQSAAALGINWDALKGIGSADLSHAIDNIKQEEAALRLAEAAWKGVGDAQGVTSGEAKKLSAAMKTIGDTAVDSADKIGAIRASLEILKDGANGARDAEMAAAGAHAATLERATQLSETIATSGEALFDASGMLNSQSSIGRDMHALMRDSADGLLIEAQSVYDAAILRGESAAQASDAAMGIMDTSEARLKELAKAAGVDSELIKADWELFFGQDWMLEATFTATADKFLEAQKLATDLGIQFSQEEFAAFLAADPDPATLTTAELKAYMEGVMQQQYQAALTAISPQAMAELAKVNTETSNWSNADYVAHLKSLDATYPGIYDSVTAIANMTGGDYKAAIRALNSTRSGIDLAKLDLSKIPPELVPIIAQYAALPKPPVLSPLQQAINLFYTGGGAADKRPGAGTVLKPGGYDGAIWDGKSSLYSGRFPMKPVQIRAFANGGIYEQPGDAKVYSEASTYRVFAEKGTGGESFIPLAASKRARSLEIWRETGRLLGADTAAFADGGITGARNAGGGVTVHIDQMVNQTDSTPEDFARSLFRKVRAAGAYSPLEVI